MRVKDKSVNFRLNVEMLEALPIIERIYKEHGQECVITSCNDGKHMKGSKHYTFEAIDSRTFFWTIEEQIQVKAELQNELGSDFDVVLEKTHFHIEYDPK